MRRCSKAWKSRRGRTRSVDFVTAVARFSFPTSPRRVPATPALSHRQSTTQSLSRTSLIRSMGRWRGRGSGGVGIGTTGSKAACKEVRGATIRLLQKVGIDVERRRRVAMAKTSRNSADVDPAGEKLRGDVMAEIVEAHAVQSGAPACSVKVAGDRVRGAGRVYIAEIRVT